MLEHARSAEGPGDVACEGWRNVTEWASCVTDKGRGGTTDPSGVCRARPLLPAAWKKSSGLCRPIIAPGCPPLLSCRPCIHL